MNNQELRGLIVQRIATANATWREAQVVDMAKMRFYQGREDALLEILSEIDSGVWVTKAKLKDAR